MTRGDDARVADILAPGDGLARVLRLSFENSQSDEDLRVVTPRLVERIGDVCRALTDDFRAAWPDVDWFGFVGLRNVLAHAYHRIQPDLLWTAATRDVPALAAASRTSARRRVIGGV